MVEFQTPEQELNHAEENDGVEGPFLHTITPRELGR